VLNSIYVAYAGLVWILPGVSAPTTLAQQTGFVQRRRQISGADFVQGLVFGWLHQPQASMGELGGAIAYREVSISDSGLTQRFTPQAATFLQAMLAEVVAQVMSSEPVPIPVLQRFQGVIIEDSSQIALPDELREQWRGCGGNQQHTEAAAPSQDVAHHRLIARLEDVQREDHARHEHGVQREKGELLGHEVPRSSTVSRQSSIAS